MATDIMVNATSATVTSGGTTHPVSGTVETWTVNVITSWPSISASQQFRIIDAVDLDATAGYEIILVTSIVGTTWTVTRGVEGTEPKSHTAGFTIIPVATAGGLDNDFLQIANSLSDVGNPLAARTNIGINFYNIVEDYGADPTGVADSAAAINAALTAATNNSGLATIVCPAGTYSFQSAAIGSGVSIPADQAGTIFFLGDGDLRTIFMSDPGVHAQVANTQALSVIYKNICFDGQGANATIVAAQSQYLGGGRQGNCTASVSSGVLAINLNTTGLSSTFPSGTLINLQNTRSGGNTTPNYDGSVNLYRAGTGPGGTDQLIVNPNPEYPTVTPTVGPENVIYGYATCPVSVGFINCRSRNRGVGSAVLSGIGKTGLFTLSWGGNTTPILNCATITSASLATVLNQQQWADAPSIGWICAPLNPNQIVIYGIESNNFSASVNHTGAPSVVSSQNQGFGINIGDTNDASPQYLKDVYIENLTIENDLGEMQESLNLGGSRLHLHGINYRNTFESRAAINPGSNLLTFDGMLLSPPVPTNFAASVPGTPIAVQGAGAPYGPLTTAGLTASVTALFPTYISVSPSPNNADLAALVPGTTVNLTGGQSAILTNVITPGTATVLVVNESLTPVSGASVTLGSTPLYAVVSSVGTVGLNGQTVTQLQLTANAAASVTEAVVGVCGGRGPLNVFAFDHAYITDVHATLGGWHHTDIGAIGVNYGRRSNVENWDTYTINDPFYVAGTCHHISDALNITASNWVFPSTCYIEQSTANVDQTFVYNNCELLGGIVYGGQAGSTTHNGTTLTTPSSGLPAPISQNSAGDSGPIFFISPQINTGTGVIFGGTGTAGTASFEFYMNAGGSVTYGGILNSSFTGSHTAIDVGSRIDPSVQGFSSAVTSPSPTSTVKFQVSTVFDALLFLIGKSATSSFTLTYGPSTGTENTAYSSEASLVSVTYPLFVPAGNWVIFTGTVGDFNFTAQTMAG